MCRNFFHGTRCALLGAIAAGAAGAAGVSAQTTNPLHLSNGGDGIFMYSDPSIGGPPGSPNIAGDLYWKVFPKETLRAADGAGPHTLEVTSIVFTLYDTDWSTPPQAYDILFTRGQTFGLPDNIGPDFTDPNAVLITFPASWWFAPNPCLIFPGGCTGPCPISGFIAGWQVVFTFAGPAPGSGIVVRADGTQDLVVTSFLPGGMTFQSGPPGWCGEGDYTLCDWHSSDMFGTGLGEHQAATPSGNSPYGGFRLGGVGTFADDLTETLDETLYFREPIVEGRTSLDPPANSGTGATGTGLSSLRFTVGGGTNAYGVKLVDEAHVGDPAFVIGSVSPQLLYPGLPLFGTWLLIDPSDPIAGPTANLWSGTLQPNAPPVSGLQSEEGYLNVPLIQVPAVAAGLELSLQGVGIDLPSGAFFATGTFRAKLLH